MNAIDEAGQLTFRKVAQQYRDSRSMPLPFSLTCWQMTIDKVGELGFGVLLQIRNSHGYWHYRANCLSSRKIIEAIVDWKRNQLMKLGLANELENWAFAHQYSDQIANTSNRIVGAVRSLKGLDGSDCEITIEDLASCSKEEFAGCSGVARITINFARAFLNTMGLTFTQKAS